jgi:hypothetical protein
MAEPPQKNRPRLKPQTISGVARRGKITGFAAPPLQSSHSSVCAIVGISPYPPTRLPGISATGPVPAIHR